MCVLDEDDTAEVGRVDADDDDDDEDDDGTDDSDEEEGMSSTLESACMRSTSVLA